MSPVAFEVAGEGALTHAALLYPGDRTARRGALLVLAHGAGSGHNSPWMIRYAQGLSARGLDVVTFNFPYMDAGRRAPDRAPVLEVAFRRAITAAARHRHVDAASLFIGGKSMGGRMATHLAADPDQWPADAPPLDGVVVFGYPLHPPGASRRSPDRVSHLLRLQVPTLVVQGTRDAFGGPDDLRRALGGAAAPGAFTVHAVEGGDHSLAVRRKDAQPTMDADVWETVVNWIARRG